MLLKALVLWLAGTYEFFDDHLGQVKSEEIIECLPCLRMLHLRQGIQILRLACIQHEADHSTTGFAGYAMISSLVTLQALDSENINSIRKVYRYEQTKTPFKVVPNFVGTI